jgi:hypothetical protein
MLTFDQRRQKESYHFLLEKQQLLGTVVGKVLIVFELIEVFFEFDQGGLRECGSYISKG